MERQVSGIARSDYTKFVQLISSVILSSREAEIVVRHFNLAFSSK